MGIEKKVKLENKDEMSLLKRTQTENTDQNQQLSGGKKCDLMLGEEGIFRGLSTLFTPERLPLQA